MKESPTIPELPLAPGIQLALNRLWQRPWREPDLLAQKVERHLKAIRLVADRRPVDAEAAEALAVRLHRLLESSTPDRDWNERRLIQLACEYFCRSRDIEHDLESTTGLRDDQAVYEAVLQLVGEKSSCES